MARPDRPRGPQNAPLLWRRATSRGMHDRCIDVFNRLSREQAERFADMFDVATVLREPDLGRIREIAGDSFTDSDLVSIAMLYLDLTMGKINAAMRSDEEYLSDPDLDADKRPLLEAIAKRVRDAADERWVETNLAHTTDRLLGRRQGGRIEVRTMFAPISSGGPAKRLIPRLVVSAAASGAADGGAARGPAEFQLDIEGARELVSDLQAAIGALEAEIRGMRAKFGDVVVHD